MEKPKLRIEKHAEKTTHKIRLPQIVIKQMGSNFYMEIYKNKIILKPIKDGE